MLDMSTHFRIAAVRTSVVPPAIPRTRCLETLWTAYDALVVRDFPLAKECLLTLVQKGPYCPIVVRFLWWLRENKRLQDSELTPDLQFLFENETLWPEDETLAAQHVKAMEYYWIINATETKNKNKKAAFENLRSLTGRDPGIPFAKVLYGLCGYPDMIIEAMKQQESWAFHRFNGEMLSTAAALCFNPSKCRVENPKTKKISQEWIFWSAVSGEIVDQINMLSVLQDNRRPGDLDRAAFFAGQLVQNAETNLEIKSHAFTILGIHAEKKAKTAEAGAFYQLAYETMPNQVTICNLMCAITKELVRLDTSKIQRFIDEALRFSWTNEAHRNIFYENLNLFYTSQVDRRVQVLKQWGTTQAYEHLFYLVITRQYFCTDKEFDEICNRVPPTDLINLRICLHFFRTDLSKAKTAFFKIKNLKSLSADMQGYAYCMKASIALADGDHDLAKQMIKQAIQKIDKLADPELFNLVGFMFERLGQFENAESWYRKAHTGDTHNPIFLFNLGTVLLKWWAHDETIRCARTKEALLLLKSAADLGDTDALILYHCCSHHDYPTNQLELIFQEIKEIDTPAADCLRGLICLKLDQEIEAYNHFMRAMLGGYAQAYTILSVIYANVLAKETQDDLLDRAVELGCHIAQQINLMKNSIGYCPQEILQRFFHIKINIRQPETAAAVTPAPKAVAVEDMSIRGLLTELKKSGSTLRPNGSHVVLSGGKLSKAVTFVLPHGGASEFDPQARSGIEDSVRNVRLC